MSSSGMKSESNIGFACELFSVAVSRLRWPSCVAEGTFEDVEDSKGTYWVKGTGVADAVTESLLDLW